MKLPHQRKTIRYVQLGILCVFCAVSILMVWIYLYQDGQAVLEHPYAPVLPYLAGFTFLLAFSSFYFACLEHRREIRGVQIGEGNV